MLSATCALVEARGLEERLASREAGEPGVLSQALRAPPSTLSGP